MNDYEVVGMDLPDDFTDKYTVENIILSKGITHILHIGAIAGLDHCMKHPTDALKANVLGTQTLARIAAKHRVKFVHTSTWAVEGHLKHPYDITKKMAEDVIQMNRDVYGLQAMIIRLGTLYGWGMRKEGVIWAFLSRSITGQNITIQGDGKQFRQFLNIKDCARAYEASLNNFKDGAICEVQPPEQTSVLDLANSVYPENPEKIEFVEARKGDEASFYVDPEPTQDILGWKAEITIKDGMQELKRLIVENG